MIDNVTCLPKKCPWTMILDFVSKEKNTKSWDFQGKIFHTIYIYINLSYFIELNTSDNKQYPVANRLPYLVELMNPNRHKSELRGYVPGTLV